MLLLLHHTCFAAFGTLRAARQHFPVLRPATVLCPHHTIGSRQAMAHAPVLRLLSVLLLVASVTAQQHRHNPGAKIKPDAQKPDAPTKRGPDLRPRRGDENTSALTCEPYCAGAMCASLEGHPDIECAKCDDSYTCHPGAEGYPSENESKAWAPTNRAEL